MDYYSLDKHCPSILSPPVISSTCSGGPPDNGLNEGPLYVGGAGGGNSFRGMPADSCSYGHAVSLRHDNSVGGSGGVHVKMELLGASTTVEVSEHVFGNGQFAYYNLNGGSMSGHHSSHMGEEHQIIKKNGGHYHHMQQSSPAYSSSVGSVLSNCPMSPMDPSGASMYGGGVVKEEFDGHHTSIYSMQQQCTSSGQSSAASGTSPILLSNAHSLPDSPPIVSSNSAGYHSGGSRHSLSPPTINNSTNHHHHQSSHRNGGALCIAKKSSSSSSSSSSSTTGSNNVCSYELKREMAESSGLSLNGAPYAKSRAGRKGYNFLSIHFYLTSLLSFHILSRV